MSKTRLILLTTVSLAGALAWQAPANAADAPVASTTSVNAVIVTAERRATDIQKTPIAVTAVQPAAIEKSFITDVAGLGRHIG